MIAALILAACTPTVTDGATVRICAERVRIAGIDAPEIHGCQRNRVCTPGDGWSSKRALAAMLSRGPVYVERVGRDRYGRSLARIYVNGANVGCQMIATGHAVQRYADPGCAG